MSERISIVAAFVPSPVTVWFGVMVVNAVPWPGKLYPAMPACGACVEPRYCKVTVWDTALIEVKVSRKRIWCAPRNRLATRLNRTPVLTTFGHEPEGGGEGSETLQRTRVADSVTVRSPFVAVDDVTARADCVTPRPNESLR